MSEQNLIQIHSFENWNEDVKKIADNINKSTTTVQQLKEFRELTKLATDDSIHEYFVDLYFSIGIKNPIRSCIENAFKQINEERALQIIDQVLQQKVATCSFHEKLHLVCCLNETSKGFKIIQKVIGRNYMNYISKFLLSLLNELHTKLIEELSPIQRGEFCAQIHITVQTILYFVKCQHNESKNLMEIKQELSSICEISYELLDRDDISMDTKNNCGVLIVTENDLVGENSHLNIIRNEEENASKRLNLIMGLVQLHDPEIGNITDICNILFQIFLKNSVDAPIVLAVLKLIFLILRKLSNKQIIIEDVASIASEIAITNVEHNVDAIKHLAKNSLRCIFELNNMEIADKTFKLFSKSSITSQAIIIKSILPVLNTRIIFEKLPNFQNEILSSIHIHTDTFSSCYELLSTKMYGEMCFEEWFDRMINPILSMMKSNEEEQDELKSLLTMCIKCDIKAIEIILKKRDDFDDHFILLCLNAAKNDLLNETQSTSTSWRGVISYEELRKFLDNFNEEIQLSALQLIIQTRKSTEEFSTEEIQCIMHYYKSNMNIQSQTTRQSIIGMAKKFFERLQNLVKVHQRKNETTKIKNILEILVTFFNFGIKNLDINLSHSRRILSLKILQYSLEVLQGNFQESASSIWSEKNFNAVLNVLMKDTFEANKEAALEVLKFIPSDFVKFCYKHDIIKIEKLITSISTSDSIVAAYFLQFAINFSLFDSFPSAYEILLWCERILMKAIEIARKSFILSGGSCTLYGPIYCIRFIVERLNMKDLHGCQMWQHFFTRIIKACRDVSEIVGVIVNSSAPEGIYPDETIQNFGEADLKVIEKTTPQMILVNAWRAIKEISLFLGDLSLRGANHVLNTESILNISEHLLELMTKTKHRGAFEQAFYGFSQICIALRLSNDTKLHLTPTHILQKLVKSISGCPEEEENISDLSLCATRRSAGLPFIIQAIVLSELRIATNKDFHFTMKTLLSYAKNGTQLESRVHSLNILRALFNCKELKECSMEYVSEALQCSLNAYDAETWAERNSSTLLFSTLIVKIFGPQHTKNNEEICIRNKMNAKLFFLRFPALYDFIYELLQETQEKNISSKKNAKLHPVLILLNRLCPSYDEVNASQVKKYIPIVEKFINCSELQTRVLCAKFIANSLPSNYITETILSDMNLLEHNNISSNAKHGLLLKILNICKRDIDNLSEVLSRSIQIYKIIDQRNLMCINVLLEIIIEIISKLLKKKELDGAIVAQLECILSTTHNSSDFGFPLLQRKIVTLNLIKCHFLESFEWLLNIEASENFYELTEKLNCILMYLDADYTQQVFDRYELDLKMFEFVKFFSNEKLKSLITFDHNFKSSLKLLILSNNNFNITVRSFEILSYLECNKGECNNIKEYAEKALDNKHEDLSNAILKYVTKCIKDEDMNLISTINWNFLDEAIESSFFIKLSCLDILETIITKHSLCMLPYKTLFHFVKTIMHFLIDDDIDVRCKASMMVSALSGCKEYFNPSRSQNMFLLYLQNRCNNENIFLSILILLAFEEKEIDTQNADDHNDQVLFKHNESNTFKEQLLLKQQCLNFLTENNNWKNNDEVLKLCTNLWNDEDFANFLRKIIYVS